MSRVFRKTKLFYDKIRIRLQNGEEVLLAKTKKDNDLTEIKLHLSDLPNLLIAEICSTNPIFYGYKLKLEEIQKEPLTELEKCKKDINYFIENYCTRSDGSAIELTNFQKELTALYMEGNVEDAFILHGRKQDYLMYKKK